MGRLDLAHGARQQSNMSSAANVTIHPSQFPEAVQRDLMESLRTRQVNHKFHYDSYKQTEKWLTLHEAYSPARTDTDCLSVYDEAFVSTARNHLASSPVHVIGLGCGGGQKDTRLLELLQNSGKTASQKIPVAYTPSDVSVAMVLVAREKVLSVVKDKDCHPLVCDLATAEDLEATLQIKKGYSRLITFFGMIPNFDPQLILPRLAKLVGTDDYLLFSANLAPGPDYAAGVQRVLPLYDNALTRDWLMTFLLDLGVEQADGEMRFGVEDDPAGSGLKRIVANFYFQRSREVKLDEERFEFRAGEAIRLFFSYRHTPERVRTMLEQYGLSVIGEWVTKSEEEGVFLCRKMS